MLEESFRSWIAAAKRCVGIALITLLLPGCTAQMGELGPRDARDIISADEVSGHSFATAYGAVYQLRPWWLDRPSGTRDGPVVFLDEGRMPGGFLALHRIAYGRVLAFRFYSPDHAAATWGSDLAERSGVIQVISRRQ